MGPIMALGLLLLLIIGGGIGGCAAYNHYRVYSAQQAGKAVLAEAQSSRQVKTLEAVAAKESAKAYADAEVIRARGAAEAIQVLQNRLGGPENYLRYLQIQTLDAKDASIIYVPTEAGLPLTEAGRVTPR
jgi:regulator of protease activity HflC (stomatin/prohibitin superfamily)